MADSRSQRSEWLREPWKTPDWEHQREAWRGDYALLEPYVVAALPETKRSEAGTEALRDVIQALAQAASLQVAQMLDLRSAFAAEIGRLRLQLERVARGQTLYLPVPVASKPDWLSQAEAELDVLIKSSEEIARDGDASPVSFDAAEHTTRLLSKLSADIQKPDIGTDVHGNVTLDWQAVHHKVFSIAVSANAMIFWAGLFGENRCHGAERFGDNLPEDLERGIRRALSD